MQLEKKKKPKNKNKTYTPVVDRVMVTQRYHRQRSLVGYNPWGRKESDTTEQLIVTKDVHDLFLGLFEYILLHGKSDFANLIKDLELGKLVWIITVGQITRVPIRGRQNGCLRRPYKQLRKEEK